MRPFILSSVSLLALAAAAQAETVVVSATRTPENLEVTGASLSLITADDIEAQQTVVLSDILATVPGVTVVRNGGIGQSTSIYLRGSEAGQSVVMVDGVRINDPSSTSGQALMGDVLANGLERVEVLRGPQSTLYGSDAIGGVVNMITARGGDNTLKLTAEAGSLDTVHLNAAGSGSYSSLEYGAAANFYVTNSVSAADYRNGNSEADGYHHFGATGNLRWHVTDDVSLDARAYYTRGRDSFDDNYPAPNYTLADSGAYNDNELLALYGGINADFLNGRFTNRLAITHSDSNRNNYDADATNTFWAKGGATSIEYQGGYKFSDVSEFTFGYEHERTSLATESQYDSAATRGAVRTDSVYGQIQTSPFAGLTVTLGERYSHNSEFGDHTSFKANVAYQATESTTLRANFGDGFKAPSLYQLYSQYSNPVSDLRPELATGWEVGADQMIGNWRASVTYFQRHTSNQIDFFSCYGVTSTACTLRVNEGGYYYNVKRSLARGVEFEAAGDIVEGLKASLSYTNLTDFDQDSRLQLARRPHDSASGTLTWQALSDVQLGATLTYTGSRFDDAYHYTKLKDRAELGLFGSYDLAQGLQVFGRIENVSDNRNETVATYGTMGRTFYAGVRAKI